MSAAVAVTLVTAAATGCGSGYDLDDPGRDHLLAFNNVAAVWDAQLTTYSLVFAGNSSQQNVTFMRILVSDGPDVCADLNSTTNPPNASRLALQGFIDGDATGTIPETTWSRVNNALAANPTQLDIVYAAFYGYDANGLPLLPITMLSGNVTVASEGDPSALTLGLSYSMVPQVGGPHITLANPNLLVSRCVYY